MHFLSSWDDGYALDLRVADLLEKYDLRGMFYVCPKSQFGETMLTIEQIRGLAARGHEIGSHTIHHPKLTKIPLEEAKREITESKKWIEDITQKPCRMFCYPYGLENPALRQLVREAGFMGARTVVPLKFSSSDPFAMPTTLQVYPFPWRRRWKRLSHYVNPLGQDLTYWKKLTELRLPLSAHIHWLNLAQALFSYALKTHQPWFHLWGHSEEIERYELWGDLERFLQFVNKHNVPGVTNCNILTKYLKMYRIVTVSSTNCDNSTHVMVRRAHHDMLDSFFSGSYVIFARSAAAIFFTLSSAGILDGAKY